MDRDYYLVSEVLWGMKDYFRNSNENKDDFNDDNKINLGTFDGLTHCSISINEGDFSFIAGNYSGTPQYEKDKRRFYLFYNNLQDKICFVNEVQDENVLNNLLNVLTTKIPKELLNRTQQQMIENSGVLENPEQVIPNIFDNLIMFNGGTIVNDPPKKLKLEQS